MAGPFALYPEEKHWWSMEDYGHVLSVVQRLRPRTVLEFGPGSSTLALLEGGVVRVDCCENNPDWFNVYVERLQGRFPSRVLMVPYKWSNPVVVPGLDDRYDMALIDGPEIHERPAVIEFALAKCDWVLFPTEDHWRAPSLRLLAPGLAGDRPLEIVDTGRLSGGFALIGPPC